MRAWMWLGAALLAGGFGGAAEAQPVARPVVMELFTSEGCSSCPPAEALLGELARGRPDVLPLAFHITYWDRLGWPDAFALRAATERQKRYADLLGLDSIYTPQVVVDGRRDVIGSDRPAVLAALGRAAADATPAVPLRLGRADGVVTLEIGAGGGEGTVLLVGYDPAHRTAVARGENAGRTISEANVVRSLVRVADWHGTRMTVEAPLPAGERLAAIVQAPDGRVLGAARLE